MDRSEKVVLSIFLGLLCLCLLVCVICAGTLLARKVISGIRVETLATATKTNTPSAATATREYFPATPIGTSKANDTLDILKNTVIPSADWVQLAEKFQGKKNIPLSLTTPPIDYHIGDTLDFWTENTDTNVNKKITAYLAYKSDHVYLWVEQGITINKTDLKNTMDTFTKKIYPTDQEFFGKEWIPGVDNDPHLYILYAADLGSNLAGYCSSIDTVLPEAHAYSNAHEMFAINADNQALGDEYTLSVMAHEFQHLIHGYHDPNEETWLNEGFSELAVLINGYDPGGFDYLFAQNPDIQLNEWPNDPNATDAHYGSSFLFTTYLLDRFGENTTKAVVAAQSNGLNSFDEVFKEEGIVDPHTGKQMTADQFFQDWTIANYLDDGSVQDGRFAYTNNKHLPSFGDTETIYDCAGGKENRDVSQYGTDYIHFECDGNYTLTFSGASTVDILPVSPIDGTHFAWSNKADLSDMTMSQQFDFTGVKGNIAMNYLMWYDLETDYDFVYLLSSTDGESWHMVNTPSCTTGNVTGNNYGCGYNDVTNGWKNETVDLSQFAGQKIWLRFEYVTDTAVTGEGFAVDKISIPAINYQTDFENDNGGWNMQGFVRIQNQVPQTFLVSLIQNNNGEYSVNEKQVAPGEKISFDVADPTSKGVTLVVSGSTRYSRQKADYQFEVEPKQ